MKNESAIKETPIDKSKLTHVKLKLRYTICWRPGAGGSAALVVLTNQMIDACREKKDIELEFWIDENAKVKIAEANTVEPEPD